MPPKRRLAKRKFKKREYLLTFQVEDYCLETSIGASHTTLRFRDLSDGAKLWEIATYLKITGRRVRVADDECLALIVMGDSSGRDLGITKGDYLEYAESGDGKRTDPKTRIRNGVEERVYHDVRGFGYCGEYKNELGKRCWSLSVSVTCIDSDSLLHFHVRVSTRPDKCRMSPMFRLAAFHGEGPHVRNRPKAAIRETGIMYAMSNLSRPQISAMLG